MFDREHLRSLRWQNLSAGELEALYANAGSEDQNAMQRWLTVGSAVATTSAPTVAVSSLQPKATTLTTLFRLARLRARVGRPRRIPGIYL